MTMWSDYVKDVSAGVTNRVIAETCDPRVNQTTAGRWLRDEVRPSAGDVAAFANGFGRNVLEAFVAAGLLDEADARSGLPETSRAYLDKLRRKGSSSARGEGRALRPKSRRAPE